MKKSLGSFCIGLAVFGFFFCRVSAADFAGIGGHPAHPDPAIEHSAEWFIYTLKPGESKQDSLIVQNDDDVPHKIILYPADSTPSTDGGFALEQKVESRDFIGTWITLSQSEVTLQAHQSEEIPFTIAIPNDPKIDVGEHTGGILIQKDQEQPDIVGGMQLTTRVGVRVYVTIPGQIVKNLVISQFSVKENPDSDTYTASLTVQNTGNVSQEVVMRMKVSNQYQWLNSIPWVNQLYKQYPLENTRNLQVLRGDSLTSNFDFQKPLFGQLKVEGFADWDGGAKTLVVEPITVNSLSVTLIVLASLLLTCLLSLITLLLLRKREKKQQPRVKAKAGNGTKTTKTKKKTVKKPTKLKK